MLLAIALSRCGDRRGFAFYRVISLLLDKDTVVALITDFILCFIL